MRDPKVTFLLFSSGRIVCTGGKTIADVKTAVKKLYNHLKKVV
jgi:transcription initiation factor TFIID TATA-box-binding protein